MKLTSLVQLLCVIGSLTWSLTKLCLLWELLISIHASGLLKTLDLGPSSLIFLSRAWNVQ